MSWLSNIFKAPTWAKVSLDCRHYALGGANALRKAGFKDAHAITYAIDGNDNPRSIMLRYHAIVQFTYNDEVVYADPMKTSGNSPFKEVTLTEVERETIRPLMEAR